MALDRDNSIYAGYAGYLANPPYRGTRLIQIDTSGICRDQSGFQQFPAINQALGSHLPSFVTGFQQNHFGRLPHRKWTGQRNHYPW